MRPLSVRFTTSPNNGGTYSGYSGNSNYSAYLPSQNPVRDGQCNNLYCHSNGAPFDKPTAYASPRWTTDKDAVDCTSCHDDAGTSTTLSGRHGKHTDSSGYTFDCEKCHSATVTGNSNIKDLSRHVDGVKDVLFKEGGAYGINKGCNFTYCHSGTYGGVPNKAVNWSDTDNSMQCFSCHGGRSTRPNDNSPQISDNTFANCSAIQGRWSSLGDDNGICSKDLTMMSNGHHRLVGPQWIRKYPCYYCHYDTVDVNGNIKDRAKHVNMTTNVVMYADMWKIVGRPLPSYNRDTKVCDNVYCHSDGTANPDAVRPFAWTEPQATCNACHGHPIGSCLNLNCHDGRTDPVTGKVWTRMSSWAVGKEWMGALPMFPNQGPGNARANSHPRHVQSDFSCDECHFDTIISGGDCLTCHAEGIPLGSMSEVSHISGDFHVNKNRDVKFKSGGFYNEITKKCSGTMCHTSGTDPQWGGSVAGTGAGSVVCTDCHGTSGADVDTFISTVGANAQINLTQWVTTGHGRPASAGPYPVSGNPPANFAGNPCWYCHDSSVYHDNKANPFRLRMHNQFSQRFEGECVYCHMTRTEQECQDCHNKAESLAPQLANITSSHTATAKWADGTAVIRPDHTGMQSTSCMTASCHSTDLRTHNARAGTWTDEQKEDVRNQYMMMGVCLQCHDDDSNNKCAGCHGLKNDDGTPLYTDATFKNISVSNKYKIGFNPGSGFVKPQKARATSVHFGYKHFRQYQERGTWSGGKFCWDCHDPHGDSNIFMIQKQVATSTDGKIGIPFTRVPVVFTSKLSGSDYAKTSAPYNGICNVCHSTESKHFRSNSGDSHNIGTVCTACHEHRFSDSHAGKQDCNACHKNKPIPRHSGFGQPRECTKCHAQTIAKRTNVMGQFGGNSHHIQGTEVTSKQCYACHWEATPDGLIDNQYHKGYNYLNYSSTADSAVDLVVWGPAVRPTTYKLYSTAIQFIAGNVSFGASSVSFGIISTQRKEVNKLNNHCLSCHSDQNNDSQPFGDCKTPRQYAWDKQSIAARYSQNGTTQWGKYGSNGKSNVTKSFSAHGNAIANKGGYSETTGTDSTFTSTRDGLYNVTCFDCHNSHGSKVVGTTSSYVTFNGTRNGANLKETQAGKGGYKMTYMASSNSSGINPYSAGAGQCFDCHVSATPGALPSWTMPWGYQTTFGASAPIMGFMDSSRFGQTPQPMMARYPYKTMPIAGGHLKRSGYPVMLNHSTSANNKINGLCTPCHDPHGVTPSLKEKQAYAVPLLKGTWMTSPYKEDAADPDGSTGNSGNRGHNNLPGVYTDQKTFGGSNRVAEMDNKFAGLCIRCHSKANLTAGANKGKPWKGVDRIHQSVKGWGVNDQHSFTCSKCHSPHVTGLPKLMITNCLDHKHKGRKAVLTYLAKNSDSGDYGGGSGGFPMGANQQGVNCHPTGTWQDNSWNVKTPW